MSLELDRESQRTELRINTFVRRGDRQTQGLRDGAQEGAINFSNCMREAEPPNYTADLFAALFLAAINAIPEGQAIRQLWTAVEEAHR